MTIFLASLNGKIDVDTKTKSVNWQSKLTQINKC